MTARTVPGRAPLHLRLPLWLMSIAALLALWPGSARALVEIAKPGVIVLHHMPNPVYFDAATTPAFEVMVTAYRREVANMVGMGATAVALDAFNNNRDRGRLAAWKEAVRQHNVEKNQRFCFYLIADFDPNVWPAEVIRSTYRSLVDSPYYCSIRQKPVLSTYHGEQASAAWHQGNVLDALRSTGQEPFYLVFYRTKGTDEIIRDYFDVWRRAGYDVGFYRFSGNRPQGLLNGAKLEKPKYDAAGYVYVPGFGTSYWAHCSARGNAGTYLEHDGFEGLELLWKSVSPGGVIAGDYVILTSWNDHGEDNFTHPLAKTFHFYLTPDIHLWTHRGFYEFQRHAGRWFRRRPPIAGDWVYWAYRQHRKDLAAPAGDECVEHRNTLSFQGDVQDAIYVTTVLAAPGELQVTFGGSSFVYARPAGISHVRIPWGSDRGRPRFVLNRAGSQVMAKTGTLAVTDTPIGRDGEGTRNFNHYADFMRK